MPAPKLFFIEQLADHLRRTAGIASRAEQDAREAAVAMATESEKKEDSRAALEYGSLATGQAARVRRTVEELESLKRFSDRPLPVFARGSPIGLGALVDVSTDGDHGREERTFIILPVGAGTELTGPDGDGFLSVITPQSPLGRALMGKRVGEGVDVQIKGEWKAWEITDVS